MEIYTDKENGNSNGQQQNYKQAVMASACARTPLLDVKNKYSKMHLLTTDSSQKLEALNLHFPETPGRNEKVKSKRRMRSCIASFHTPLTDDLNKLNENLTCTLPHMTEDEPDDSPLFEPLNNVGKNLSLTETVAQNNEQLSPVLTGTSFSFQNWDMDTKCLEVEIADDSSDGRSSTDIDLVTYMPQSSIFYKLDDSDTSDCAEVSATALPNENELHLSLKAESVSSIVESLLADFEWPLPPTELDCEDAKISNDHVYSLKQDGVCTLDSEKNSDSGVPLLQVTEPCEDRSFFPQPASSSTDSQNVSLDLDKVEAEIMELILEAEARPPALTNTSAAFNNVVAGDCVLPETKLLLSAELDLENYSVSDIHEHTWKQELHGGVCTHELNSKTTSPNWFNPEMTSFSETAVTQIAAPHENQCPIPPAASFPNSNIMGLTCQDTEIIELNFETEADSSIATVETEADSSITTEVTTPCHDLGLVDFVAGDSVVSETELKLPLEIEDAKMSDDLVFSLRRESDVEDSEAHQTQVETPNEDPCNVPELVGTSYSDDTMEPGACPHGVVKNATSFHVLGADFLIVDDGVDVETKLLPTESHEDAQFINDHDYYLSGEGCTEELNPDAASNSDLDSEKILGSEAHSLQVSPSSEGLCSTSEFHSISFTCLDCDIVETEVICPTAINVSPARHNVLQSKELGCENFINDYVYNLRDESGDEECTQELCFGSAKPLTLGPAVHSMQAPTAAMPLPAISTGSRDFNIGCLDRNRVEAGVTQMLETLACRSTARDNCHLMGSCDRLVSETELERLQSQLKESNYKHHFEVSLLAIEELKAERDDLLGVVDDIEVAFDLQSKYKDLLDKLASKVQNSTRLNIEEIDRLENELEEMRKKCLETQKENKKLHFELKNMDDLLNRNHTCLAEMETLYRKDQEDLIEYRRLISQYTDDLALTTEALEEAMQTKESFLEQHAELQRSEAAANQALQASEVKIKELERELLETKQILDVSTHSKSKKELEFENTKSKLEMYINELQHALDTLELEKDVVEQDLYDCRELMVGDRIKLEELAKEVEALRKIKVTSQADRETIKELKNVNRLLEEEKQLCMEAISDYRNKLEAEVELNSSNEQLIEALRRNNSEIQESYNQLMSEMQFVEASLTLKTSDLDSSHIALQVLEERMNTLLLTLQEKLGQDVECDASRQRNSGVSPNRSCLTKGDSFVALVLSHSSQLAQVSAPDKFNRLHTSFNCTTNTLGDTHFSKQTNVIDGDLHSDGHILDISGLEPFSPEPKVNTGRTGILNSVRKRQTNVSDGDFYPDTASLLGNASILEGACSQTSHCPDTSGRLEPFSIGQKSSSSESARKIKDKTLIGSHSSLVPGFASIRSIPSTSTRAIENRTAENIHTSCGISLGCQSALTGEDYQFLVIKIQAVEKLFNKLEESFSMIEKVNQLNLTDLKFDMETLSIKLNSSVARESQLSSELSKKCQMLGNAEDEIKELNAQVIEMKHILLKFQDQSYDISRLEEDKAELRHQVRDLKGQVTLLNEQFSEAIEKLGSSSKKDKDAAKEILALKKMNHELTMKLFSERDKHNEVGEKAMKRMKVLESNWKKAEQEVQRFDDLVERIRQACIDSHCQSTVPVVLHIVRLIDGMA